MTTPLLTSLEQAGEGSREHDAEIGRTFGGQVVARFGDYDWRAEGVGIWRALPLFTRSLDDALALAERQGLDVLSITNEAVEGLAVSGWSSSLRSLVPELARHACIAILRATHQEQPNV